MMDIQDHLVGLSETDYGAAYQEHLLAVYQLYVQMADRISARRQAANSYFLTINTALIALVSYVQLACEAAGTAPFYWSIAVAGITLCYLWYRLIRSYNDLNSGKFKVIHEIERRLPIRPYDAEWTALGRGKRPDLYLPFTHIERFVPWVFLLIHLVVFLLTIPWPHVVHFLLSLS